MVPDCDAVIEELQARLADILLRRDGGKSFWVAKSCGIHKVGGKLLYDSYALREATDGVLRGMLVLSEKKLIGGLWRVIGVGATGVICYYHFTVDKSWAQYTGSQQVFPGVTPDDVSVVELAEILGLFDLCMSEAHEAARSLEQFVGDLAAKSHKGWQRAMNISSG